MQTDASRNEVISVAVFFITMILLTIATLYLTGGLEDVFSPKENIHVVFNESVTGLNQGSPVSISGVDVGRVVSTKPMTDPEARNLVRKAKVIQHRPIRGETGRQGTIVSGRSFLQQNDPLVLATVKVTRNSVPLNKKTRVSLITTNFTASQAVRFSAGSAETLEELRDTPVVVDADQSPLSTLRSRFLDNNRGALRKKNIKRINELLKNLNTVSQQLAEITGTKNQKNLKTLIKNHRKVASTLDRWLNGRSYCGDSESVQVKRIKKEDRVRYRYSCPSSGKEWIKNHPPKPGRLQGTVQKLDQLLVRLNNLVGPEGSKKTNITGLVHEVNELSAQLKGTATTLESFVEENRSRVGRLIRDVNHLSKDISRVASQIDREPSSAVYGRRGSEISDPYGK